MAAFALGCGFDTRSGQYACQTQSDCEGGRSCEEGWCVLSQSDASPPPDADLSPDAGRPLSPCNSCMGGECREECTDLNCDLSCTKNDCDCEFQCAPDTDNCNLLCADGASCDIDCGSAEECTATCEANSVCQVDCSGVEECQQTVCEAGAQCLLDCTGTVECGFATCAGMETSCSNDLIACNRDCP